MAADEVDIIIDTLRRVAQQVPEFSSQLAAIVEREVRRDWGGDRPYIAKLGQEGRRDRSQRNERIAAEARRGDSDQLLSRRHNLSVKRIRQIRRGG